MENNVNEQAVYERALIQVLLSIAAEETAISRVITAESKKIEAAIDRTTDLAKLVDVNKSVTNMLEQVHRIETVLKEKMILVFDHVPHYEPSGPCDPPSFPPGGFYPPFPPPGYLPPCPAPGGGPIYPPGYGPPYPPGYEPPCPPPGFQPPCPPPGSGLPYPPGTYPPGNEPPCPPQDC